MLFVIANSFFASGQMLQWSNATKLKGGAVFVKVIGENQKGVFVLRYRNRLYNKNIVLDRFNHQLVLQKSTSIELRKSRLSKLYLTPTGILAIRTKYARQQHQNSAIAQWYDLDFNEIGNAKILATSDTKKYGNKGDFKIRISDDLLHFVVMHTQPDDKNTTTIFCTVFSDSLVQVAQHSYQTHYSFADFMLYDAAITNSKDITVLANVLQRSDKQEQQTDFHFFTSCDTAFFDVRITDSLSLKSPKLVYHRNKDRCSVVGFYGEHGKRGILGTLFFTPDCCLASGKLMCSKFGDSLVKSITTNNRNDVAISDGFSILQATPRSDGGLLLIAENTNIATADDIVLINGLPQSISKNVYNFDDIMLLNYDDSAFLNWHKIINKNQTTVNDGGYFSSVVIYTAPQYVQLLYNDHMRSSGEVMQHTIYNNGSEKSKKLVKTEIDYVAIVPSEAKQVSTNKIIIPTTKNRRFALLKLVYQ